MADDSLIDTVYAVIRSILERERFLGHVTAVSPGHASVVRPGQTAPDGQQYVVDTSLHLVVGQRVRVDRYGANLVVTGIVPN